MNILRFVLITRTQDSVRKWDIEVTYPIRWDIKLLNGCRTVQLSPFTPQNWVCVDSELFQWIVMGLRIAEEAESSYYLEYFTFLYVLVCFLSLQT